MKLKRKLMAFALILSLLLTSLGSLAEGVALTLPAQLLIIDEEAFCGSTAIESVVLPDKINEIRSRAFAESSLKSIYLPASLTFIADDAFENSSLTTVTADEGTYAYDWAVRNGYIKIPLKLTVSASDESASMGDTVTWTAQGEGGAAPLLYAFQLYHGGEKIDETAPSDATTYTRTIDETGSYYVRATITDKNGDTLSVNGGLVRVRGALSIEFRGSPMAALAGEQVTWSVNASADAEPVKIAYRLYRGDDLIDSTDYADAPTYAGVLATPGRYQLVALAKDANDDVAEAYSGWVTVKSELSLNLSANTNVAKSGSTIVWTAEGSGGTEPYRYAFKLYRGNELIQSVAPGRTRTYSHTIDEAGDYYVLATMTDADNDTIAVISDEITVSARLAGAITTDQTLILEGETATWTAEAINGTQPYRYDYTLLDASGEILDTAEDAGTTYTHQFDAAGEYTLRLQVTDAAGETDVQDSAVLAVIPALSISFGKTPKIGMTGKPFTWTVEGAGGIAPRKFAFHLYQDGELVRETAFGSENTFTHTFEAKGKYMLLCLMTDAGGTTVQSFSEELTVTDYTLSVTADAESAVPDDTVTWTADGAGGTQPYQFDFELYRNGELADTADTGDTGVYSFTFIKAGEYYVLAQMTDASGETIRAESKKIQVLMEDLEILGITNPESSYTIIKAYTWTAQAHGGEKPYQYQFVLSSGSTVYYTRPFSEKPTFSYTFFDSGSYTLTVQVKDALGTVTNAYQDNFSVSNRSVSVTGVVRIYVDIDPTSGQPVAGGLGHYELQINTSGGPQFAFGDRVYSNPVFSFHSEGNGSSAGIVSVFDGDRVLRDNSRLYTWSFSSSVAGLKDFLITKMQSVYLDTANKVESEAEDAYRVKAGPFVTYSVSSSNCFVAVATWAKWMGNDRLSQEITSNYKDYGATNMYNKLGRYWTYVGERKG